MVEYIYSQTVHKDFHGITSYLIEFLRENHGDEHVEKFFNEAALYIYKPLIMRIKKNGLHEMKNHLEITFSKEHGDFDLEYSSNHFTFKVKKCPAIWHMKSKKFDTDRYFCKASTEIVNTAIAKECGYNFSVEYDQVNGKCIQKFWREEK